MDRKALLPIDGDSLLWNELPAMAMMLSADGILLKVNQAFAGRFPNAAQVPDNAWLQLLGPSSRDALLAALSRRADVNLLLQIGNESACTQCLDLHARWLGAHDQYLVLLHDVGDLTRAENAARAQAELLRLLCDRVPVTLAYYDAQTLRCRFANSRYAEFFGLNARSIVGRHFSEVIGDDGRARIQAQVDRLLEEHVPIHYEREVLTPQGVRQLEADLLPHLAEDGRLIGCFVLASDVTQARLAEKALRESDERLAKFMQATCEGIVFHKDGFVTDANPAALQMTGYTLDEILGRKTLEFVAADQVAKVALVITSGQETTYESVIIDKRGHRIPVEFIVRTMWHNGQSTRMTIMRDLRDRHAAQARINHLAHHDTLTGLPNRSAFMEYLEHLMIGTRPGGEQLALLFIDLDHFKRVNDSLGHLVGDTLLRTAASRITAVLRATDVVARFGGDEFMVLVPNVAQRAHVEEVAQKLLQALEAPLRAEGRPLSVTASIGVALFPQDGQCAEVLIKHADTAMYLAKARGRAQYRFFDPAMASSAYAALVMEGELAQALERNEFELYFQPQISVCDASIVGAEALIRWHHPTGRLLQPDDFIPVAEQQRLMLAIGQWVLREAARCAARWHALGLNVAPVAVNLSTMQFRSPSFNDCVEQTLRDAGVDGRLIELELTERMLMDDFAEVGAKLERLAALGVRISVDDFGTGYSSLGHLKALPIDKVKIDGSFVKDLPENRGSAAITRAIIQMASSLSITAIAEGVETPAQRSFLALHGCHELQGDLISKPLPAAEFEAWVLARRETQAV